MTPDEINATIADHLGVNPFLYRFTAIGEDGEYTSTHNTLEEARAARDAEMDGAILPVYYGPNYHGDLNAISRAELSLWREEETIEEYREKLETVYVKAVGYSGAGYWFMAGAPLRAEAFLRAVGKWVD